MALSHRQPDRPPVSASYTPEVADRLRVVYGREEEDMGVVMGNDLIKIPVGIENSYHLRDTGEYTCPFGVRWRNVTNKTGHYTEIIGGALMEDENGGKLRAYRIPDPDDPAWYAPVTEAVARYGDEKFIVGSCQCSIFETAWYLHGMEDTLVDMVMNEAYANDLFDKIMYFPLRAGLNLIACGVDMVWLGDDVATQSGMLFSPALWRKYFKERYAALFAAFKQKKKDIALAYHSCGNCEAILDDMVEIGLEALNPIQPLAMDPFYIKKRYGRKLTLFGAVDIQRLMPYGTPGDIVRTVREYRETLGKDGGFILSPAHHLQSDTSLENIQAFYKAALE